MGGGDKCLLDLAGRPLLAHIVARVAGQVDRLILNANGDPGRFAAYGLPVVTDVVADVGGGFAGPLAGVLTGLDWAAANVPEAAWVATFATDAPFVPLDLVDRLYNALAAAGADMACAHSDGRDHPVFALWPVALRDDLRRAVVAAGVRKVDAWTERHRRVTVDFAAQPVDPFFNANQPADLARAAALLTHRK